MTDTPVTLEEILTAKEDRSLRQQRLLADYPGVVVSITINMPGSVKDTPLLRQLLDYAVTELKEYMAVRAETRTYAHTGPEALLAVTGSADAVKKISVRVEETEPFGRLLDIDVLAPDGSHVSRPQGRTCLICDRRAVECMRSGCHSRADIQAAVDELLVAFAAFLSRRVTPLAQQLGVCAAEAMLYEAACTPAPGLVDRANSGAHRDMDFYTFMASSAALAPYMARLAQAGWNHDSHGGGELLPVLRKIGLEAEAAMYQATENINTHKGLLFSLGITAAAAALLLRRGNCPSPAQVLDTAAAICAGIVRRDLAATAGRTAGERLFRDHGVTGIRGEMEAALPSVRGQALPALRQALDSGLSLNDSLVQTLLVLMTAVSDTTVMHRHDPAKMDEVRAAAASVLAAGGMRTAGGAAAADALDQQFIKDNISPGGCADLLAVTWFLHIVDSRFSAWLSDLPAPQA